MKKYWVLPMIIFILAFSLRLLFIVFWHPDSLVADEIGYDHLAASLLKHDGYVNDFGRLTAARPPGYPIFLYMVYFIFGRNLFIVRIIQAIIGSLVPVLIYYLGKNTFSEKSGILAGLFSAVHLGFIAQSAKILTEGLAIFFFLCAVIFFDKLKTHYYKKRYYIFAGLTMGITSLIRSNLSILFSLLILFSLYSLFKKSAGIKTVMKYMVICIIAFIMPIVPWIVRNYVVFHSFVPLSTLQGIALYSSYKPLNDKIYGFTPKDEVTQKAKMLSSEIEQNRLLTKEAIKFIKSNPSAFFKLTGLKLAYLFSPFDWELIRDRPVYNYLYVFYLPFFLVGFFLFMHKFGYLAYIYLPILGIVAISVIFFGLPRFRLPIEPYMLLLSSSAIVFLYEKVAHKKFFIFCLSLFFMLNFLIFLNSEFMILASKRLLNIIGYW